jgi:hypothetical protein
MRFKSHTLTVWLLHYAKAAERSPRRVGITVLKVPLPSYYCIPLEPPLVICQADKALVTSKPWESGWHSQYSDWLLAGQPRGQSSSPGRIKNFLFFTSSRPALGPTQPPIQWVPGALSLGVKRPGREADHSPSTSAEVKKMWLYTSTPPYAFMA